MSDRAPLSQHGTALVVQGAGFLILGPSGSGKSRLACALLADAGIVPRARPFPRDTLPSQPPAPSQDQASALVADDQVHLYRQGDALFAASVTPLESLIELRGLGLLTLPWHRQTRLACVVELVPLKAMERLPDDHHIVLESVRLPRVRVPIGDLAHQCLLVKYAHACLSGNRPQ